jgi:hypothetical protein
MWTVWPERNRLSFTTCKPKVISIFKMQIISFVQYLYSQEGKVDMLKLTLVLPQNVSSLSIQVQIISEARVENDQAKI